MDNIYRIIIITQVIVLMVHIIIIFYLLSRDTHHGQAVYVVLTVLCVGTEVVYLTCLLSKGKTAVVSMIILEYFIESFIPVVLLVYVYRMFEVKLPKIMAFILSSYSILTGHIILSNSYNQLFLISIDSEVHKFYTKVYLEPGPCYYFFVIGQVIIAIWVILAFYYYGRKRVGISKAKVIIFSLISMVLLILELLSVDPNPEIRIRPLTIGIMCILLFIVLYHYEMFNVVRSAGELVFENLGQALIIVDKDLKLVEYNDAADKIFPKFKQFKQVKNIDKLYPELGDLFQDETGHDFCLGDKIYEGRVSKIFNEDIFTGYVAWMLDVTQQRMYMKQLIEMKKQAEQANSAKSDFLSRMSHDMRTPMNAVIGLAEIGNRSLENKEVVSDCLCNIKHSAKYLLALINDILDMAKIENDKMTLNKEKFLLGELMHDIEILILPQVKQKSIHYEVKGNEVEDTSYVGDALRIKQILMNVISNAVKFTPQDGKVSVHIHEQILEKNEAILHFYIQDTGIGMSEEKMKIIFAPFEQGDDTIQTKYGGSGLGLSISKQLLELMDGTIKVESTLGNGSTFSISIPLERVVSNNQEKKSELVAFDFQGRRVLLVEDNEMNIEVSKLILLMQNLRVEVAKDGLSAVNMFTSSPDYYYDYILMDIRMPVMDGLEATRRIRALDKIDAKTVPIIAMTANAYEEDIKKVKESGMNEHLEKPIDINELINYLKKYEKSGGMA